MIINLWSTPRTGSNWYCSYLAQEQEKQGNKVSIFHQYLNYFYFINYAKPNASDWVYEYSDKCTYPSYHFDILRQSVVYKHKSGKRINTPTQEEEYRINLLDKHNDTKNPLILHNHILPMSDRAYDYLFRKAHKNIFLYRENLVNQLASYALAYTTGFWKPTKNNIVMQDVKADRVAIKNLFDRILHWHTLNKDGCQIVKYEDINFNVEGKLPTKQNVISAFSQLDIETQIYILDLEREFKEKINP